MDDPSHRLVKAAVPPLSRRPRKISRRWLLLSRPRARACVRETKRVLPRSVVGPRDGEKGCSLGSWLSQTSWPLLAPCIMGTEEHKKPKSGAAFRFKARPRRFLFVSHRTAALQPASACYILPIRPRRVAPHRKTKHALKPSVGLLPGRTAR